MKTNLIMFAASFMFVACGTEEHTDVYLPVPTVVEKEIVVEKPVIVEKTVIVEREVQPKTKEITVCHVLLTDRHGSISRLSFDDLFLRNSELAREFTDAEANTIVALKKYKVNGTVSKFCFKKTVRE